jgi:large subunit ribosomal protein L3
MKKGIIGKKIGMTQIFSETGVMTPVTVIQAGPCVVAQKKTPEKDGYSAIQLGFEDVADKRLTKPQRGHFAKSDIAPKKYLREFRLEDIESVNVGDIVTVDTFFEGESVDVVGISKGKGFSGVIKRHGAGRGPSSHGSGYHRGQGSMGGSATPGRVAKGKMMAGQMGNEQVTVQNLDVVKVDAERGLLIVKGAIPGPKGGIVYVHDTSKNK